MNRILIRIFLLLAFLSCTAKTSIAQHFTISGKILDAETFQPLAFVNIVVNNSNTGGVSDIDGRFQIHHSEPIASLTLSYVGYARKNISVENPVEELLIKLERLTLQLAEVVVVAGENPAHRIIENAIANRNRNNYERLPSFSYTSYDKMIFTADADSLATIDPTTARIEDIRLISTLASRHFFIIETVAKRQFLYPGRDHQKVIASRVSGFKDPVFTFLLSELQSTSFYEDVIKISDKNYVNPLSSNSTIRYTFIIEDTLFSNRKTDTTFVISYRPKTGTNFDGLKGLLYINSNKWAVQNVIAEPHRPEKGMTIRIQQMYELIDDLYWFPVQLNTDVVFQNARVGPSPVVAQGKSYITDIVVKPELVRRMFSDVKVEVEPDAAFRTSAEWDVLRKVPLSEKDFLTYYILDSLGKIYNYDRYAMLAEALMSGNIPAGKFNIPMQRILRYNKHEKLYVGIGLNTSERISRNLGAGAFVGYGYGSEQISYGAETWLQINRQRDARFYAGFSSDLAETGKIDPFEKTVLSLRDYRSFLINRMDRKTGFFTGVSHRIIPYLTATLELDRNRINPQYDYGFRIDEAVVSEDFKFTELSLSFRFAYREKFLQTGRSRISLGTNYPVLWFRYARGFDGWLQGGHSYHRCDLKVEHSFYTPLAGETSVLVRAGIINGNLPYPLLYSGFGSYSTFGIYTPGSFAAVRMNEFTADRYAGIYLTHNFGKLLFRRNNFEPEVLIATHAGFGYLSAKSRENHLISQGEAKNSIFPLNDFPLGYFESGFQLNNLINLRIYNLGFSAFYRYGPYSLPRLMENLSLQLSLNFPLQP